MITNLQKGCKANVEVEKFDKTGHFTISWGVQVENVGLGNWEVQTLKFIQFFILYTCNLEFSRFLYKSNPFLSNKLCKFLFYYFM